MQRYLITVLFILFLFSPAAIVAEPMSQEEADALEQSLSEGGAQGFTIDLNVRLHIPRSENPHIPEGEEDADLWATVIRPKNNNEKLPTILFASGYTRVVSFAAPLLVPYGYNLVVMDLRGTGSSGGVWSVLDLVSQYDVKYVIDNWIPSQEWSDGKIGMIGESYLAMITTLAAGLVDRDEITGEPTHLKAIFPMSFTSDVYHGAGVKGGTYNIELMASWITGTSLLATMPPLLYLGEDEYPPSQEDIEEAREIQRTHRAHFPEALKLLTDVDKELKSEFWDRRSSMIYWPIKPEGGWSFDEGNNFVYPSKLPVFSTGGWYDLFTRGVFLNYQYGLSQHSDSDKAMIIGEWGHVGACSGLGIPAIMQFQLHRRWFDWKIKGKDDCFMAEFPVILRVMGEDRWRGEKSWPLPESRVENKTYYFSKTKATPIKDDWFTNNPENQLYALVDEVTPKDIEGDNPVLKHWIAPSALHGLTSKSTQRWFYGGLIVLSSIEKFMFGRDIDDQFFWEDERSDDWKILTFTTEPLEEDVEIVGPVLLKFWAKTKFTYPMTQVVVNQTIKMIKNVLGIESNLLIDYMNKKDVQWVVELNDVFPNGRAKNLTSGWLQASHRQYNPNESDYVKIHALDPAYTPFDPFYNNSNKYPKLIKEDELYEYAVEIWPTCNVFKAGHRIRLTISGSDFPHILPILRPSSNEIVIDDDHEAVIECKITNPNDEGKTWKWIGPAGNIIDNTFNQYLLTHRDERNISDSVDVAEDLGSPNSMGNTASTESRSKSSSGGGSGCFISSVR